MSNGWHNIKIKLLGLKGLATIGFADITSTAISGFFWFFIISIINPEEYGQIQYFLGIAGIASVISLFGTQNAIMVYAAKNIKIQSTVYLISLIAGLIASSVIITYFHRFDSGLLVFGYIISTLAIGDLLGRKLFSTYSKYVLIQKSLTMILGIAFYYGFGYGSIIYALTISYVFYSFIIYKNFKESKIDFRLLKSRIRFIASNYTMNLVTGFYGQIDKIIVTPLLGFVILGNYGLAMQVISVLLIFSEILFKYSLPHDSVGISNKKLKKISIIGSVCVSILGITILPNVFSMFFPKYEHVIEPIRIMSIGIIPATINTFYTSKFLAAEKSRIVLGGTLTSLLTITLGMIIFGKFAGIIGISIAFVLSVSFKTAFFAIADRMTKNRI